jgi:archaellum biogenesis ATPase FlaH
MEVILENRRNEPNLKLINMEQVEIEKIDWLLYPFIPFGKVTIVQGDPGEGKTTMVLQIIAKLTKGEAVLPSGSDEPALEGKTMALEPVNVIYQTAEDGLGDTIKPRLLSAGADCSRVMVIDDNNQALTMMDARLEEAIIKTKARLVVLDPIQGFLGAAVDMHRANEIRPLMKRIAVLAEKYHCAIILIGHMNKNSNGKSSYRGLGSIDFQAAARSVLIVGRIKDEPEIRVVCHVKSSLAPEGKSIAFRLDKDTGFEWIGEYDISADDLLSGDNRGQKIHAAKEFLKEILASGSVAQTKVAEEAESRRIKKKTLWNAKKELEIDSVKIGNQWFWMLPE